MHARTQISCHTWEQINTLYPILIKTRPKRSISKSAKRWERAHLNARWRNRILSLLSVLVLTAPGWRTEGGILRGHQGGIWRGQTGPLWLTEGTVIWLVEAAGKLTILCFVVTFVEKVHWKWTAAELYFLCVSLCRHRTASICLWPRPGRRLYT